MLIAVSKKEQPYFLGCLTGCNIPHTIESMGILVNSSVPEATLYKVRRKVQEFCRTNFITRRFDSF